MNVKRICQAHSLACCLTAASIVLGQTPPPAKTSPPDATPKTPAAVPRPQDAGWVRVGTRDEPEISKVEPALPSAKEIAEAAFNSWKAANSVLLEKDDLKLVLETTLEALIKPDFDAYDKLLSARGCTVSDWLKASIEQLRSANDLGYPKEEDWKALSDQGKVRAYWNAIDFRHARWKSVKLSELKAGMGYNAVGKPLGSRLVSFAGYAYPGIAELHNACVHDQAPVAFVQVPVTLSATTPVLTLCFCFSNTSRQWFPFCLMVDSIGDPNCVIRF